MLLIQQPDDLSEPMQQGAADPCCQQNAEEKGEPTPHKSAAKPSDYPYDQDSPTEGFNTADVSFIPIPPFLSV